MTLTIEIISDFICPWCLVVDTRLNQAIKQLKTSVEIERIGIELNPTMPEAGMERKISFQQIWQLGILANAGCSNDSGGY